jgi:ankyrin repeat protein
VLSLLAHYPDLTSREGVCDECLQAACAAGSPPLFQHFLDRGASPTQPSSSGATPLMLAGQGGNIGIVEKLIQDLGADPLASDPQGMNVLLYAANAGQWAVVAYLLANTSLTLDTSAPGAVQIMHRAVADNAVSVLEKYVTATGDVTCLDSHDASLLHTACRHASLEAITWLVEHGADVECKSSDNKTPLDVSAKHGHVHCIRLLVIHGAELHHATIHARSAGHTHLLAWLEAVKHFEPLHMACEARDVAAVCALLIKGANPRRPVPSTHLTPLSIASTKADYVLSLDVQQEVVWLIEEASKRWSPRTHHLRPSSSQAQVHLAVLLLYKLAAARITRLPYELMLSICEFSCFKYPDEADEEDVAAVLA